MKASDKLRFSMSCTLPNGPYYPLLLDILLQPSQPLLRLLQHLILLANRKPQPVLGEMSVRVREELGGRDGRNAQLLDAEPRELEVAWAIGNMGRERVVCGQLYFGEVDEDEVATFGFGVLAFVSECLPN